MNILLALYLFCSAIILLFLAVVAWRRRTLPAGREFALFSGSIALLVASYALELTQTQLAAYKPILLLEWCFAPYTCPFWLIFSAVWCGYSHLATRSVRIALIAFSTHEVLLALTNNYHGLVFTTLWMDNTGAFPIFNAKNGPWFWVDFTYMNICLLIATILFTRQFRKARSLHRRQALIMLVASIIPWFFQIGYSLGVGNGIYITAFGLSISGMLFAWGIFRQHLLDMTPVARHGLVEMMPDPVLVFDEAGRLVDHNRAASLLLHDTVNLDIEITRDEIARHSHELAQAIQQAEQGKGQTLQVDGQVFALSLSHVPAAGEKTLTLCLFHDITEQHRVEKELQAFNAMLEERIASEVAQNRAKDHVLARQARIAAMGEMVAAIAHQWRQPLAILSMIVQDFYAAAREDEPPSPSEWDEFKVDSLAQIRHMSQTIDEFRNFQRPDQQQECFPVARYLEEALRLCSAQFREYRITRELNLPPGESPCCFGVPSQLTQVLLNMLSNAKEAIDEARRHCNGEPEEGLVVITLNERGERLLITLADNGCGVPEVLQERIFEPYITTREERGGSGLGLYLARMLVESGFGGRLSFTGSPKGAIFVIDLPVSIKEQS